jgi:hypothetical protein
MQILILGNEREAHATWIFQALRARGIEATYWDTMTFPNPLQLSYLLGNGASLSNAKSFWRWRCNEPGRETQDFLLDMPHAVYWRSHNGFAAKPQADPFLQKMAYREIESALGSLMRLMPCRWVNSAEAVALHTFKPVQLQMLHAQGLDIPQTLISNNPDDVLAFFEAMGGNLIFKPVRGGAHTEKLTREDLTPDRLACLAEAPVTFQECIPGVDIRVYIIGQALFAAEIRATSPDEKILDFRADDQAQIVPITLPPDIQAQCFVAAKTLGLVFTGLDIRRTEAGRYAFLDINPSPMFIHFERMTGYPITDSLVDLLTAPHEV